MNSSCALHMLQTSEAKKALWQLPGNPNGLHCTARQKEKSLSSTALNIDCLFSTEWLNADSSTVTYRVINSGISINQLGNPEGAKLLLLRSLCTQRCVTCQL